MKSHEVLKQVCKKKGAKKVAAHLNLALATVHRWSRPPHPNGSGIINPLDRIAAIQEFTGDKRAVEWLCGKAGGFFVADPPVNGLGSVELAVVFRDIGHVEEALAETWECNSAARTRELRRHWETFKSHFEWLVRALEQRSFGRP